MRLTLLRLGGKVPCPVWAASRSLAAAWTLSEKAMVSDEASSSGWANSCTVSGHSSVSHLHPGVKARTVSQKEELRAQIPETATPQGSGCSVGDCSKRKRRGAVGSRGQ